MFAPSLHLLQQAVHPGVCGFASSLIKVSASPSMIHRVALEYSGSHRDVTSVIIKSIAPVWPNDPHGPDREYTFYARLLPHLDLTRAYVHYLGVDPETDCRLIVMEDLVPAYRFRPPSHVWTAEEARCMVRAYAHLHVRGLYCLPPEGERTWMWRMALQEKGWAPAELLGLIDDLVVQGIWSSLPSVESLLEQFLADSQDLANCPATLLHNDVYPPNIALPVDLEGDAILLDWEMLGWGPAELDLAFMFMQPFGSHTAVDRFELLDYYWVYRQGLEGVCRSAEERRRAQRCADAQWALSLVPVAHRVAANPYPAGSAPRAYWDAMFGVLHERLRELSEEL